MAITYTAGNPEASPSALEPGEYHFRVVDAEEKNSAAGNPMIALKLRHIRDDGELGRQVFDNLVFVETALWKVDQFLAALGIHPGSGQDITLDGDNLIGREARAKVVIAQDSKGRDRNEIDGYVAAGDEPF